MLLWQAAEKVITIHEITRSSTKPHEEDAVFLVLFRVRSYDFVDRMDFLICTSVFQQPASRPFVLAPGPITPTHIAKTPP